VELPAVQLAKRFFAFMEAGSATLCRKEEPHVPILRHLNSDYVFTTYFSENCLNIIIIC